MQRPRAFTIIELLVVVSIIALLIGVLLPAISKARDQAKVAASRANMRNLATAHASYAAEWNDRHVTWVDDNLSSYGSDTAQAMQNYQEENGRAHPSVVLGWGAGWDGEAYNEYMLWGWSAFFPICQPIVFDQPSDWLAFGSFRQPNARALNQYVNGHFYDAVFYAPKDLAVLKYVSIAFDSPFEYVHSTMLGDLGSLGWSSYCLSPAAMFSPDVMRNPELDGWQSPWDLPAGFRCPSMSQALYPGLKTHMIEHHWLQQARAACNPGMADGSYGGCEPYYFNHGWESVPVTLFYDGHVESLGVREAEAADSRHMQQAGFGLWSRDTALGEDGYLIDFGYDFADTSYHVLTTDGIRGRDTVGQ